MTVLDSFITFARVLPEGRRQKLDDALAMLMAIHSDDGNFSAAELEKIDRRLAEPRPEFANPAQIAELFGKPFGA